MTFPYPTVLCMPTTGHVYDISVPDSFVYAYYKSHMTFQFLTVLCMLTYMTFHYLTVLCMPTTGHVYEIFDRT